MSVSASAVPSSSRSWWVETTTATLRSAVRRIRCRRCWIASGSSALVGSSSSRTAGEANRHRAFGGTDQPCQHAHGGRFAGAVEADQRGDLATFGSPVQGIDGNCRAELLRHSRKDNGRLVVYHARDTTRHVVLV